MSKFPYRLIFLLGTLAFFITLAVVIGQRLSTEAMAVLMGVIAGVVASIPTSMLVSWIAIQMIKPAPAPVQAQPAPRPEPIAKPEQPQIVVLQQPMPNMTPTANLGYNQANWNMASYPSLPQTQQPRKFTVIGGNAESEDLPQLQPLEMVM
jgi:hypothetical protein